MANFFTLNRIVGQLLSVREESHEYESVTSLDTDDHCPATGLIDSLL